MDENTLKGIIKQFNYYKSLGDKTFTQLNNEDIHYKPNEYANNIAIVVKHIVGNMLSRWTNFKTEDGEKHGAIEIMSLLIITNLKPKCSLLGKKAGNVYLMPLLRLRRTI